MAGEAVLVVDDNPTNMKLVWFLLEKRGYVVRTASSAHEALEVLRTFPARLILMDLQMPDMDGYELTRQLKSDPATKGAIIVALTAYAMKRDEQKALDAGCDGYLTKPVETGTLCDLVASYLAKAPPRGPR